VVIVNEIKMALRFYATTVGVSEKLQRENNLSLNRYRWSLETLGAQRIWAEKGLRSEYLLPE
jgi:hypothetical protein